MSSSGSFNPFFEARDQLATVSSPPSGSYKTRVIVLLALSLLLVLLGLVYIVLVLRDLRKRGKKLRLLRLRKTQAGRLIVLNALFIHSACAVVGAVIIAIERWRIYEFYYLNGSRHNLMILNMQAWTPEFIGGLAVTHSNLNACMSLRQDGRIKSSSRAWVFLHNGSLVAAFVIFFGITIPLGVQGNDLANTALARVTEALTLLTEAGQLLEDGGNIWSYPARTAALQTELLDAEAAARRKFQIIIISASVFAIAFSLAAVASWSFVIKLRNQSRVNRSRRNLTQASVFMTRDQQTVVEVEGPGAAPAIAVPFASAPTPSLDPKQPKSPRSFGRALPFSSAIKKPAHEDKIAESAEHAALTRLAYSLSLSVPCIVLLGGTLPILGLIGAYDTRPQIAELRSDAYAWMAVLANLILVSWFIVTFLFSPGRYTSSPSQSDPISNGGRSHALQLRMHKLERTNDGAHSQPNSMLPGTPVRLADLDDAASGDDGTEKVDKW